MLYRHIFIAHGLRLVLRADQNLIQIIAHIKLAATAYLRQTVHRLFSLIHKHLFRNVHLSDQLQDQAVFQSQQAVQQMLLLQLLVSMLISELLTILDCFHRFLCKFIDIHNRSPFRN